ncbi:hypothetical protein BD311DRAFT_738648 [Dichomitus squalens]|uniref:Uncharacterized protein n=1 Tax=Dichomitus squalens TaxID=114155 RepID=A0A4Q9MR97_9APHY|nr:hypothetical protein BD311DRAFT_738648 [Dichomitus squalens]
MSLIALTAAMVQRGSVWSDHCTLGPPSVHSNEAATACGKHHFTPFGTRGVSLNGCIAKNEHKSDERIKNNLNGRTPTLIDHKSNNYCLWLAACHALRPEARQKTQVSCRKPIGNATKYDNERRNSLHELKDQMYQTVAVFPSFWSRRWTYSPGDSARTWVKWVDSEGTAHIISRLLLNATRTDPPRARHPGRSVLGEERLLVGEKCIAVVLSLVTEPVTAAGNTFLLSASSCDLLREILNVHKWRNEMLVRPAVSKALAPGLWKATSSSIS